MLLAASSLATLIDSPLSIGLILAVLFGLRTDIYKLVGYLTGKTKAKEDALEERFKKLEECVGQFVDKDALDLRFSKMGKEIGENEQKIKSNHDGTEGVINTMNGRINALEIDNRQLTLLPGQFNGLHTDHKLLAQKVDNITKSVDEVKDTQVKHFDKLMTAIGEIKYEQGKNAHK